MLRSDSLRCFLSKKEHYIIKKEVLVRQHPCLPCQREVARVSGSEGFCGDACEFAEGSGEMEQVYRESPSQLR